MSKRDQKISDAFKLLNERLLMGSLAIKQVELIDKPYSNSSSTIGSLLRSIDVLSFQQPIVCEPVRSQAAVAADIVAFGNGLAVTDLLAPIRFNTAAFNLIATKQIWVLGYLITQRFQSNAVASNFTLQLRNMFSEGPGPVTYTLGSRDITVIPQGGANSASEYAIFNMMTSGQFPYNATTKQYDDPVQQNQGFIVPFEFGQQNGAINQNLGIVTSAALFFKDQVAVAQNISVTPILCHQGTAELIADMVSQITPQ